MLIGEYRHNIDDKNRLIIPSKYRQELGETFIITRGIDKCLFVYSLQEWKTIIDKLNTLSFTKKDARSFTRFFLSGAQEMQFDKQGRINITSSLVDYAGLFKECVIVGVNNRLEIFSSENWDSFINTNIDSLSDIAENLFDSGIDL